MLGLNLKTAPFQNLKVRQAMHYLVDYDGMVNSFLDGKIRFTRPSGPRASGPRLMRMNTLSILPRPRRCLPKRVLPTALR